MSTGPEEVGSCAFVLHSHLPWVAHAGAWPVGEEWLYQAWTASYVPVLDLLGRLAAEGRSDVLTLGVTPVLAAMLDDPYCLDGVRTWTGTWLARAEGALGSGLDALARYEGGLARSVAAAFDGPWRHGASPVLRALADSGAVEVLGGPAAHPFQPMLEDRVADLALATGLDDAALRLGRRPEGIWAPECAYAPGMEERYARHGVGHFLVDGPNVLGRLGPGATACGWRVGGSDVVAFARDLDVAYRVWSPRVGYPGGRWYRDFHTFDHPSGLRPARVTSRQVEPQDKRPYDPPRARAALAADVADFVQRVRERLVELAAMRDGRRGLVVVAYDTELFGHWWHEGPAWLEAVLRALPEAGVRVTTLRGAVEAGHVEGRADLPKGSWGAGKDWHVWTGDQVGDLVALGAEVQRRLLAVADKREVGPARDEPLDQLAREVFLTTASDWAFDVTHDSAADYARRRAHTHAERAHRLADALESHDAVRATRLTAAFRALDGPFGHLDARALAR